MIRTYLSGILISGGIHLPLLKQKEYTSFALATILWPLPLGMWTAYAHYVLWGTYQHGKRFPEEVAIDKALEIIESEKSS